ncbi:unnamed protein product, partial [Pylaiella littoralis]
VTCLLEHVEVRGMVLDCCGSARGVPSRVLTERGIPVTTNDLYPSHVDVTTDTFYNVFSDEMRRPDWIVTSPPYKTAFAILKQTLRIGRVGVAYKLRLDFLEPTKTRGRWFAENSPDKVVVLPRATYRGRRCCSTEAWFVWNKGKAKG